MATTRQPAPRAWVGSSGLMGSWAKEPRLDPTRYEWTKNENGRWFARPRTELTGLNDQQTADIHAYDRQSADQAARISAAYQALGTQADATAAATQRSLTDLTAARGAGYAAADPTGAVLGQAARDSAAASTAPIIAGVGRTPTLARDAGQTSLDSWMAQRLADRTSTIAGYRNAMQSAATAAREQNLKYLSDVAGNKTDLAKAQISADTATQDRSARLHIEAAKLEQQAQIARDRNQTQRAIALDKAAAAKRKDARAAGQQRKDIVRRDAKALGLVQHLAGGIANPDGSRTVYSYEEIVQNLLNNFDLTPKEARRIATRGLATDNAAFRRTVTGF